MTRPVGGWRARLAGAVRLLTGFWRRREQTERLEEEIRFHLDLEAEHHRRAGLSPEEAARAARVTFGGQAQVREETVDEIRSPGLAALGQDVRYGIRTLQRTPGFTLVTIATLALGIGATTVFFSVADHVVLRPLPFPDADRLVLIRERIEELSDQVPFVSANANHFLEWRRQCQTCGVMAAAHGGPALITIDRESERLGTVRVSAEMLPLLGAVPVLGRHFTAEEDAEGGGHVVILGDGLWRRLGANPEIVGTTITLDGQPREVVGVLQYGFRFPVLGHSIPRVVDAYVPLALTAQQRASRGEFNYGVIARLPEGGRIEQARAELGRITSELNRVSLEGFTLSAPVMPLKAYMVGSSSRILLVLLGAVAAVLLIVCVNLAHLMLARNLVRAREWSLRMAIGAHQGRLVRQTLTESIILALAGGALGVLLSRWGLAVLLRLAPVDLPRLNEITLDTRVLAVAFVLSVLVGVSFGALPAWRSSRTAPADALKGGGRSSTEGRRALVGRGVLIAGQTALCAALLATMGLFLSSLMRIQRVDPGFEPRPTLALDLTLPVASFPGPGPRTAFIDAVLTTLAAAPGVRGVAVSTALPLEGDSQVDWLGREHDPRPTAERPTGNVLYVSPEYFTVMGTPVRRGRGFTEADRGTPVVVISEGVAAALWPGEDPLGKRMWPGSNDPLATVIGVTGDLRTTSLEREASRVVYLPYWSSMPVDPTLLVATGGDPTILTATARAAIRAAGTSVAVSRIRTLESVMAGATASRRFQLVILIGFAVTAVVIAAVGIYGVVGHSLEQRRNEIGIRLALGARPADVRRRVLRDGLVPVAAGLAVGLAVTIALGGVLAGLLFGVRVADPITIAAVAFVILTVAAVACWLPARRATANIELQRLLLD